MTVKDIPSPKTSSPDGFIGEFYEIFKKQLLFYRNCFRELEKEWKLSSSFYEASIILTPKLVSDKILKRYL